MGNSHQAPELEPSFSHWSFLSGQAYDVTLALKALFSGLMVFGCFSLSRQTVHLLAFARPSLVYHSSLPAL